MEAPVLAICPNPKCGASVREDHPYPWCIACGERFPESLQGQIPRLKPREGPLPGLTVEEVCPRCGNHFTASRERDFAGFREATCPFCGQFIVHPLKWSYRITYWVFFCLSTVALAQSILQGGILEISTLEILLWLFLFGRVLFKDLQILRHQRVSGGTGA